MAETPIIRQRILDDLVATVARVEGLDGAAYDRPFDHARAPFAWVYDFEEEYDAERTTGQVWSDLRCGVLVAFRYDEEDGVRASGNVWLGRIYKAVLADATRGGWAFDTLPDSSTVLEAAESVAVGTLLVMFRIRYYFKFDDMTTQSIVN